MYILVTGERKGTNQKCTFGFQNEAEIKEEVIKVLDARGWDTKNQVDLRSISSCLNYLYNDKYINLKHTFTTSFDKYIQYKEGRNSLIG